DGQVADCLREGLVKPLARQLEGVQDAVGVIGVGRVVACTKRRRNRLDPRHRICKRGAGGARMVQTSTGRGADAIPALSSDARSNSSSESTGVPSNGSSRVSSSHERQPPYSSRTLTVTGRGIL